MKKSIKIILIILGVLIALLAAVALLIPRLVDPNQYKSQISGLVKEKTGRDLAISGDISFSVFPWLGAEIGETTLGNPPGFETDTFARIRQVKVKMKLLPLLSKQFEAGVVTLEGLVLNLERAPDGRTNWEDLSELSAADAEAEPVAAPSETTAMPGLAVGGLDIRDARISWSDQQADTLITVKNLNLKTSAINLSDPVSANLDFELDAGPLGLAALVDTDVRIELDPTTNRYAAKDFSLRADLTGEAIPGGAGAVSLSGNASFDGSSNTFDLEGIRLETDDLNLAPYSTEAYVTFSGNGDLAGGVLHLESLEASATLRDGDDRLTAVVTAGIDADLNAQKINVSNLTIRMPEFSMQGLETIIETKQPGAIMADLATGTVTLDAPDLSGSLSGEAAPGGDATISLDLHIQGDLNRKSFTAAPVSLSVADITTTMKLVFEQQESGPRINGNLAVAPFNLRRVLSDMELMPETADPEVMGSLSLEADLSGSLQGLSISALDLRLDDTHVTGKADAALSPAPAYTFDIALDAIDVDRYLPPPAPETAAEKKTEPDSSGGDAPAPLPVDPLRNLELNGKLAIGKLKINNLNLSDIELHAIAKEGLLVLDPLRTDLYSGTAAGNIEFDVRGPEPLLALNEKLAGVQSGNLLEDLQGEAVITGLANAEINLSATGTSIDDIITSLGGMVSFTFSDGSIKGIDIVGKLCNTLMAVDAGTLETEDLVENALQMLTRKAAGTENTSTEADSTSFSEVAGSMIFSKGVGASDDLSLKSPLLRVKGEGALDLAKQHLNYDATAVLVKSCRGQGGKETGELKNVPIPLTVAGPLTDLEVKPNVTAGLLEIIAHNQKEKTEDAREATDSSEQEPETVEDAVTGILQDLLKSR